jgi:hypothetical protein
VFTDQIKLACIERELKLRKRHYPRWVKAGTLHEADARHEIAVMEAIRTDYRAKVQPDLLLEDG